MGFKTFSLKIALRTAGIMLTLFLCTALVMLPDYHAATALCAIILILLCADLVRYVSLTNAELVRFLEAARYADYSQRFELKGLGAGFGELGQAFDDILQRFRETRAEQEQHLKHLKAIVEQVPVPLISLHSSQQITVWNNAARRLFGNHTINKLSDMDSFGTGVSEQLATLTPGERQLLHFQVDDMHHQLSVSASHLMMSGQTEMLISLQDIRTELDSAQLQAWQDLVRVLTHEIMNSITPVASLAKTTVELVDDALQ